MMATNYALRINAPTSTATNVTVATASTTAGSISFGVWSSTTLTHKVRVWMKADVKTHIRFGASDVAACTTTDMYLTADIDYVFDLPPAVTNARVKRSSTSGILRWATVA